MPDALTTTLATLSILLATGFGVGALNRDAFSSRWLIFAAALVFVNGAALSNLFGVLPDMFSKLHWNWQGKILAVLSTLAIALHPAIGWRRIGLTLAQNQEGRRTTYVVLLIALAAVTVGALLSNDPPPTPEDLAFQLTMPGLDEETGYRGLLLLALNEAFKSRKNALGIELGFGALFSCALFGMAHGFIFTHGQFGFDVITVIATGLIGLFLLWLRERTGSLVVPIIAHNCINSIQYIL